MYEQDEYGAWQTNPIDDRVKEIRDSIEGDVSLEDPELSRITRLRLISDPGFPMWDLSYCYGQLKDGTNVRVHLPWGQFSKRTLRKDLVEMCKSCGVYGKGIGILDEGVISKCQ
jgi:hypothetical protein